MLTRDSSFLDGLGLSPLQQRQACMFLPQCQTFAVGKAIATGDVPPCSDTRQGLLSSECLFPFVSPVRLKKIKRRCRCHFCDSGTSLKLDSPTSRRTSVASQVLDFSCRRLRLCPIPSVLVFVQPWIEGRASDDSRGEVGEEKEGGR